MATRKSWLLVAALAMLPGCHGEGPTPSSGNHEDHVAPIRRIAFGSCAFQWEPQPIHRAVVAADPDLYLLLGDAIYADFDGKKAYDVTEESLRTEWRKLGENPDFRFLQDDVPILATWDNHDYGKHDGGAEFPLKEISREIFLDFFGEPADSERRAHAGIYDARILGPPGRRVQIVLLDTRFFKGPYVLAERPEEAGGSLGKYAPNTDPEVTLLGEEQWNWLEAQLREPAELRLIASSTQIVADEKGMDEWGNYPHERRRLFELIETTRAEGVVLLSGNVHFAEISRTDEGPFPLVDFTSSGLTHVNEEYPQAVNSYRVAGPYVDLNFGLVEIDWEAGPSPEITLRVVGVDGVVAFEYRIPSETLRPIDS
jgi:alkaline phosphatase D